jgi:hypothetical protein
LLFFLRNSGGKTVQGVGISCKLRKLVWILKDWGELEFLEEVNFYRLRFFCRGRALTRIGEDVADASRVGWPEHVRDGLEVGREGVCGVRRGVMEAAFLQKIA